ncbi:NADPH-dependent FMN reductase [Fulvivirga lutimaris]|uniref:NADPH-dependent FMN reductase n=1 Tax=Fulvivirga lutimaris TaxID=1819566 RepID=UPI0012BC948C|nr:NAD(P)H-dependent oxidoreductase [Fulvivirga lutimaris]MTI38689.1 NADPH-dependent oxidoreductase [Fulvivirga lutimaris]
MALTFSILYGSVREKRQGIRAVKFIQKQVEARGHKAIVLDAKELPLPFLDKMYKEFDEADAPENMKTIANALNGSDAFIVVTGEYNHSIPPALKNMLDHFQKEYFFKPSGIAAYSAGQFGGMRAAVHVRAILAELATPSIPTMASYPKIQKVLDENGEAIEEYFIKSTNKFLDELEWYAEALKRQRTEGTPY